MLNLTFYLHKTWFITRKTFCRTMSATNYNNSLEKMLKYLEKTLIEEKVIRRYITPSQHLGNMLKNEVASYSITSNLKGLKSIYKDIDSLAMKKNLTSEDKLVRKVDDQCCTKLKFLTHGDTLGLLFTLSKVLRKKLITTCFYDISLFILCEAAEKGFLKKPQIIQLLFFLSLQKDKGASYLENLQPYIADITKSSLIEKCITVQTYTSTFTKIPHDQIVVLENIFENQFHFYELIKDPDLFKIIAKGVVINSTRIDLVLGNLSRIIIKRNKPLNFKKSVCILNLYAKAKVIDSVVIHKLFEDSMNFIKKDHHFRIYNLGLDDMSTFLWSVSMLDLSLNEDQKILLWAYVNSRFEQLKHPKNLDILVNSILSSHLLECWCLKMIKDCLAEKVFSPISKDYKNKFYWRSKARLQLLMTQLALELNVEVPMNLKDISSIGYTPSENIVLVHQVALSLVDRGFIDGAMIECPIAGLVIPGVTVHIGEQRYHIDILDSLTSFRNTHIPNGLMKLKIRLLPKISCGQIIINGDTFEKNSTDVKLIIEDKIKNLKFEKKTVNNLNS